MSGQHWAVVSKVDIDGSDNSFDIDEFDEYEIEHPPDCPRDEDGSYVCAVGWQEHNGGVRFSLKYSGTAVTAPGRYPIVSWHETIRGFDYTEHDGGLAIGEEPAAAVVETPAVMDKQISTDAATEPNRRADVAEGVTSNVTASTTRLTVLLDSNHPAVETGVAVVETETP